MTQLYQGTALIMQQITSFLAKKLQLNYEEDEENKEGIEFDLTNGQMFFVDEHGTKELITTFSLAKDLPGLIFFKAGEFKTELEKQSISTLRMVLSSRIESINLDTIKLNIINDVLQAKLREEEKNGQ